jgi:hypothetical protein
MAEYVGLDVSKEETTLCVMDGYGKILARGPRSPAIRVRCSRR